MICPFFRSLEPILTTASSTRILPCLSHDRKVDFRMIAATHQNLEKLVQTRLFRADLFYRVSAVQLTAPSLMERVEDIPALAQNLLGRLTADWGREPVEFSRAALALLQRHLWPGNIRELQNVIERAVILSPGSSLQVPPGDLQLTPTQAVAPTAPAPTAPAVTLADAEREHILAALGETGWVVGGPKGAAARLGMKRSTLYKKMKKLGIVRLE